jgi:Na+/melibiose symporter-like transporter
VPADGSHRVLLAMYAVFALAAGARSAVQLVQQADEAPVAYTFSALAACTYVAGWFAIRRAAEGRTRLASVMLWVELAGVAIVGTLSLTISDWFPDASVWSGYGIGYGFVPAILPIVGLRWLGRLKQRRADPAQP